MSRTATMNNNSGIDKEALLAAVDAAGLEPIKKLLSETMGSIFSLVVNRGSIDTNHFSAELHKACGRLALLGANSPRLISREIKASIAEGVYEKDDLDAPSKLLLELNQIEFEIRACIDDIDEPVVQTGVSSKSMGFVLTSMIVCYFAGLATYHLTSSWWLSVTGFYGMLLASVTVFILRNLR